MLNFFEILILLGKFVDSRHQALIQFLDLLALLIELSFLQFEQFIPLIPLVFEVCSFGILLVLFLLKNNQFLLLLIQLNSHFLLGFLNILQLLGFFQVLNLELLFFLLKLLFEGLLHFFQKFMVCRKEGVFLVLISDDFFLLFIHYKL